VIFHSYVSLPEGNTREILRDITSEVGVSRCVNVEKNPGNFNSELGFGAEPIWDAKKWRF
jgi:hypothetical protein